MVLDISASGKIVLKEVDEKAWAYIQAERERTNASPEHWVFGREIYDGTVYITATPEEDKTELVRLTDKLISEFGLKPTNTGVHLLLSWRREAAYSWDTERANATQSALEGQIRALKSVLQDGCTRCSEFCLQRRGDDTVGYCKKSKRFCRETILEFTNDGMETKFYPYDGCKYLN